MKATTCPGGASTEAVEALPVSRPGVVARFRIAVLVGMATTTVYGVLSVRNYRRMDIQSWDLGIFEQAVRNLAHGDAPISLIKGPGYNLFGDHFHPVITLLVPAYWIHGSAVTLLIAQALLFGLAALVVTWTAVDLLGEFLGLGIGVAFGLSWGLQGADYAQFHEIAFGVPLMALALSAMVRQRWRTCALWAAPLVFVKEDLGLTVIVLGFLVILRSRRRAWRIGTGMIGWGALWFVLAVKVFLPMFNVQSQWDYASHLDYSSYLFHPWLIVWGFVSPSTKIWTLVWIFLITGFLALRSSIALALLPTLAWRFLSMYDGLWTTYQQYNAILMPIAFVAMIDTVARIRSRSGGPIRQAARGYSLVAAAGVAVLGIALPFIPNPDQVSWPSTTIARVMSRVNMPARPLSLLTSEDFWQPTPDADNAAYVLSGIPDGASVESAQSLMAYLTNRVDVYDLGHAGNSAPDFLVVDRRVGPPFAPPPDIVAYAEQLHPGAAYHLALTSGPFVLVQRQK
jgi:uncharacterized membrane protein